MKTNETSFISIALVVTVIAFLLFTECKAQAQRMPLPQMWISKQISEHKIKNFTQKKLIPLANYTGIGQPDQFYLGNFLGMIRYFEDKYDNRFTCLHVYIGAYFSDNTYHMMLIFAPADLSTDVGTYYQIPEGTAFPNLGKDQVLDENFIVNVKDTETLFRNYINFVMPGMFKTIDNSNGDNYLGNNLYDTKCISYCALWLKQLITEISYQHTLNSKTVKLDSDMIVRFAAFDQHETNPKIQIPERLFLGFDFTDASGNIVYLDDFDEFESRKPKSTTNIPPIYCDQCGPKLLDNGTLCPPASNCPNP